ncbi:MAG: tRNA (guanosine(37)-N1)-methyltransferase TrmD [Candidatus Omnitrophica bacterium]|nr:tRNA (guanosine(37)-N1)-methyltransferase TrmD [Candidatus Omnitrophota bacterium]
MRVDIVTIFPDVFEPVLNSSILKRAQESGRIELYLHNLRDYTTDKRRTVDDRPYGGGPGMVMKPEPIFKVVERIEGEVHPALSRKGGASKGRRDGCSVVLMSPAGRTLTHALAQELSGRSHLVILCGHYEGVDERVRQTLVDREVSIGDYVLTGGELPAMVLVDCVARLIPGVLGHADATKEESFTDGLLEYPQYTRPVVFRGMAVPDALRSGDHEQVATWRKLQAVAKTLTHRPDLVGRVTRSGGGASFAVAQDPSRRIPSASEGAAGPAQRIRRI